MDVSIAPWSAFWLLFVETAAFTRDVLIFVSATVSPQSAGVLSGVFSSLSLCLQVVCMVSRDILLRLLCCTCLVERLEGFGLLPFAEQQRRAFVSSFPAHESWMPEDDPASLVGCVTWVAVVMYVIAKAWSWEQGAEVLLEDDGQLLQRRCREVALAHRRVWLVLLTIDDTLASELLCAHRRGVDVRIISGQRAGIPVRDLSAAGVPVVTDNLWPSMRQRFLVVDGTVMTGSRDLEHVFFLRSVRLVRGFASEFNRLWQDVGQFPCLDKPRSRRGEWSRKRENTPPPRKKT